MKRRLVMQHESGYYRLEPRPSPQELADFYRQHYTPPVRPHDPDGRAELISSIVHEPGVALDIGCGRGEILAALKDRGWQVFGVEPGIEDAKIAADKGITVVDELPDPIPPDLFDLIMMTHVLEHLPDPEDILARCHRALRRRGVLFVEVPNDFSAFQEVARQTSDVGRWWVAPEHLNYFDHTSLRKLLEDSGFEVGLHTADFPMELFLLMGENYVNNPGVGRRCHEMRVAFETAMQSAGSGELLRELYDSLAQMGLGRNVIMAGVKR